MFATLRSPAIQSFPTVPKLAEFIGVQAADVTLLLEEGRLGGAILETLRNRGVSLTPTIKNSVQTYVRMLEPREPVPDKYPGVAGKGASDRTSTIMFTDIVGSTKLIERLGDRAARRVLSDHDEIIRRKVVAYQGSEIKGLGDGFMLSFPSVRGGLGCAIDIQIGLAGFRKSHPEAPISVRIGLAVGEPIRESSDLYGKAVIMAARIASVAGAGQVLVGPIAYALASSGGDFQFRPVGLVELKGLAGAHQLYEVSLVD